MFATTFFEQACIMFIVSLVGFLWLLKHAIKSPAVQKGAFDIFLSFFKK